MQPLTLGPFELTDRIGQGGMGEVWAAHHTADRQPVAVKLITDARALKERFQAAFRNEARAMAGMQHPGIARIYEYGVVPPESSAFRPGTPYLVMERLDRPIDPAELTEWPRLRAVLAALLDALAHAHARGLVHRDLKPDNILWSWDGHHVKLTDFGVAHAMHAGRPEGGGLRRDTTLEWETLGAAEGGMVGTPNYMAPEQVKGEVRTHGPWTDLYAMGCLAFKIATGRTPFEQEGSRPLSTMMAHLTTPVPPMVPRMPVPPGFEEWVRRLLDKAPEARFRKAADAAFALDRLPDPGPDTAPYVPASPTPGVRLLTPSGSGTGVMWAALPSAPDGPDGLDDRTVVDSMPPAMLEAATLETGPLEPVSPREPEVTTPPMPDDWRAFAAPDARGLAGVGLGLFGLRRVPFVGREAERDRLWQALVDVAEDGRARAMVLRGPAGYGKSRLAEWLVERADELGAANGLRALHGEVDGPGQGLEGMLEGALRCVDLPGDERVGHIRQMLAGLGGDAPGAAEALAAVIAPRVDPRGATMAVRFARPEEHYATILRLLERMAAERPVVVVLDDAQFSRRALDFCAHVLDAQARRESPILLVLTVRDEDLVTRLDTAARVDALAARGAESLHIGPLAAGDRQRLMNAVLALDDELMRRIDERAEGNALFAVQLIGDWVQRGALELGPGGFRLVPGVPISLPDDLAEVWATRVDQLLADRTGSEARALELAAVLGLRISGEEWRAVCAAAGLRADPALVEVLIDGALAHTGAEGPAARWAFAHGMLREALLHRARAARRLAQAHRVCARVLARRAGARTSERVARHLLAAGRRAEAVPHLLDAARRRLDEGDYATAGELIESWREAVGDLPDPDPAWGSGWLLASRLARLRGVMEASEVDAHRAQLGAERHGWTRLRAAALVERGVIAKQKGMFAEAETLLRAAGQGLVDDPSLRAECSEALGLTLLRLGERERGVAALEAARADYDAAGDKVGVGRSLFGLARDHLSAGEADEAKAYNEAARAAFESTGARGAVAACRIMDGELARAEGVLDAAAEHYRAALELWESLGAANAVYARLNLGFTLVEADRFDEAWSLLESALDEFGRQGIRVAVAAARAGLLPVSAASGDWSAFDEHIDGLTKLLDAQELGDLDTARLTEKGAWQALAAGDGRRASVAATLAVRLWTILGRADRAQAIGTLARLG